MRRPIERTQVVLRCATFNLGRDRELSLTVSITGVPPKLLCSILRFRRAHQLLMDKPRRSLAEIANESGYFDQAHFSREFRRFAGVTPAKTDPQAHHGLIQNVRFIQDAWELSA